MAVCSCMDFIGDPPAGEPGFICPIPWDKRSHILLGRQSVLLVSIFLLSEKLGQVTQDNRVLPQS